MFSVMCIFPYVCKTFEMFDRDWDLISICIYTEFCIGQLRIPLGIQSTDATANGGSCPRASRAWMVSPMTSTMAQWR